jgi:hypothetical protein
VKRKRGPDLGSLKEEKIDGITLRQKAEKCKIWLQIAASPISQILEKKTMKFSNVYNISNDEKYFDENLF